MARQTLWVAVGIIAVATAIDTSGLGYSTSDALSHVYLSAAAYCPASSVQSWSCKACDKLPQWNVTQYCYDAKRDVAAFVAFDATTKTAVVSFRGTVSSSIQDWIDDLEFSKKVPYPYCATCGVHSGFYESYMALRPQILAALGSLGGVNLRAVDVTGHSLGAAMATLCAFDLHHSTYRVGKVYTFGQPRAGDAAFAQLYTKFIPQQYRVVHWRDIVPHLPLMAMDFHHVPTEVWYQEDNTQYQVCNGSGEDPNCSDSLEIAISVSDHLNYLGVPISHFC